MVSFSHSRCIFCSCPVRSTVRAKVVHISPLVGICIRLGRNLPRRRAGAPLDLYSPRLFRPATVLYSSLYTCESHCFTEGPILFADSGTIDGNEIIDSILCSVCGQLQRSFLSRSSSAQFDTWLPAHTCCQGENIDPLPLFNLDSVAFLTVELRWIPAPYPFND